MVLRQPIIATLGHVDHGKTSLLDKIRGTATAAGEAGGITQAIGTTEIPSKAIEKIAGDVLEKFKFSLEIPGLLFIDTPGHEAFSTLRRRGGSISDLAMLVIDINEGIMPQTQESINILKNSKVPFVIVMNKIDRISGWTSQGSFLANLEEQGEDTVNRMEEAFYKVVEQLSTLGLTVDRFDRIQDYTKTIAAIPVSAQTGEGLPELLGILVGLSQKFISDKLEVTGQARGSIMEIKEVKGMGMTIDTIIYDGSIKKGEYLAIGGTNPKIVKIRSLLLPQPMQDIRTEKKFTSVNEVHAASGVKISAPGLDNVISGSPIATAKTKEGAQKILEELEKTENVEIETENEGLILRADSIGSLEALLSIFSKYPIKEARVGNINKESIIKAESNVEPKFKIVISFNSKNLADVEEFAKDKKVDILSSRIIYKLEEDYAKWREKKDNQIRKDEIGETIRPGKLKILPDLIFRASNPAVVGCEVLGGIIKAGYPLINQSGVSAGKIKLIQDQGENVEEAKTNQKIAVSIDGVTVGRTIKEGETLYTDISQRDYIKLVKYPDLMNDSEKLVLVEIEELQRKDNPTWGL
jgi:translation initiation factor 5B